MGASPIRAALFALLGTDDTLSGLATSGIHHQRAPEGTAPPYCVFNKQAGTEIWSMQDSFKNQVWQVKGICRGSDAEEAEAIDERCAELLNDAPLEIAGHTAMFLRRESDVDYPQDDGGETIFYVGGLYRLYAEPFS